MRERSRLSALRPPYRALVLGVLFLGAGLRFASLGFDLDLRDPDRALFSNHIDARTMVWDVHAALARGSVDPGSFCLRGPAGFLVFGAVDAVAVAALAPTHADGWSGALRDIKRNPSLFVLLHRGVSALAGVLSVLVVMRLVRREFDERSSLCAGLVLAVAYLHVRESHLGTVDVLSGLAALLALDSCFQLLSDPSPRRYARSGLLVGAAVAAKYFGLVLGSHLCLAHVLARRSSRARGESPPGFHRLALAFALVPIGFLLLFPGIFFGAASGFVRRVTWGADVMAPTWSALSVLHSLAAHLQYTFAVGLGEPAFAVALAGFVLAWHRGPSGRFLPLAALGLTPVLFLTEGHSVRYGISLLVLLSIPAGLTLAAVLARIPRPFGAVVLVGALAPSFVRSLALDRVWQNTDTRLLIYSELRQRCVRGERVLGLVLNNPFAHKRRAYSYVDYPTAAMRRRLSPDLVLKAPPPWILWSEELLPEKFPGGPELQALVRARYREVLRLDNRRTPPVYRSHGAVSSLGVPYGRPWTVERPGPVLTLYRRVD